MLFNSLEFLLYFPVVVGLYFLLPPRWRWLHLLVASYVFYMAWEPAYAVLIFASTVVDYTVARAMPSTEGLKRRLLLMVSLTVNLGLLFSFKYYNLINNTFQALCSLVGVEWALPESNLLLPVGISFYTFQTLAYTIDVYRHHLEPEKHFGRFALYVSYFPQLVAGPIERAGRLLPQLAAHHSWDTDRVVSGLRLMLWGLFKKVVVADRLAGLIDPVFTAPEQAGGFVVVMTSTLIGLQVYYDFSAYSDIAIGAARVMGVKLMTNFDQPYLARSVHEFWARWHISLITWFRDYVYIPLGGSRAGKLLQYRNIMAVFVLSGLWHGAAWHFAIWGAINGVFIIVGAATGPLRDRFAEATGFAKWKRTRRVWQWSTALIIVSSGHLWFRVPDVPTAVTMYSNIGVGWSTLFEATKWDGLLARFGMDTTLFVGTLLLIPMAELIEFRMRHLKDRKAPTWLNWVGDWVMIVGMLWLGKFTREAFVYFQF